MVGQRLASPVRVCVLAQTRTFIHMGTDGTVVDDTLVSVGAPDGELRLPGCLRELWV